MNHLADQAERDRIRTSLDETLVVEAAAGTGKTTELIRRLINVLAEGRGTVQSVAALAFTEKAAGELKLRVRAGLEEERGRASPGSPRRAHLDAALAHLEEARISTIHGFCNDLLHERPVEARVDPEFQVLSEVEAKALYAEAFGGWIQSKLEDPPEGIRRALRRRASADPDGGPSGRLRAAEWQLAMWRYLRARWRRVPFDRNACIDSVIPLLYDLADAAITCSNPSDRLYHDLWPARRLSADIRLWERVEPRDYEGLEAALTDLAGIRNFRLPRSGSEDNYRRVTRAEVLAHHTRLVNALDTFARQADADLAALLQAELFECLDRCEELKARAGVLDFVDLLLKTRDLVRDRRDLREALQGRLTHIFVDEFQDTDPLQAEILLLLAADDPAVDRWREVVPAPGKLFIVGDPKQSIYRFRGGDIGTYREVKSLLCGRGAALLQLVTSFRAVPSLQRLVNSAFAPLMVEDPITLQAGYARLAPYRVEPNQHTIVALSVPRPYGRSGLSKAAIEKSLPDAVGAFVGWLLRESGWKVTERDRPEALPIEPRHVCLLFRRFSDWGSDITQPYVEALEARDVPHLLVGGKSFYLREEVDGFRTALNAVEWPDDELSIYGTLKGPFFAIGDEELLEWRRRFGRLHPYRGPGTDGDPPVPDGLAAIAQALSLLRELHRRRNERPAEETINELMVATRAHAGLILRHRGEQALANVMRIADLARSYEASGGLSFRGFIERLAQEAKEEAPEAPIVEEGSEGVRIMTVHKAKGLEFPVVVLADITANIAQRRAGRYVDAGNGLCALRLAGWSPWDLLDHEAEELARDRAEGVRLAYVAATRARDLLVVPAVGDDPFAIGWDAAGEGWVAPVQRAMYPPDERRRLSLDAPGCPGFGDDSVLERPNAERAGSRTVRPGRHALEPSGEERYDVVWWDPARLGLDMRPPFGIRREDLIVDTDRAASQADMRRYEAWQLDRARTSRRGAHPSIALEAVSDRARRKAPDGDAAAAEVTLVELGQAAARPGGARFGALVHAVLAAIPLDAGSDHIDEMTGLQARILAAPPEEAAATRALVAAALATPLMMRARAAWTAGRCRREAPIAWVEADGVLVEGVLDLAFEDEDAWTIIDFKTRVETERDLAQYHRQVGLYAAAVAKATGRDARGYLMLL